MSETEIHTGKVKPFKRNPEESLYDFIKRYLDVYNIKYDRSELNSCLQDDPDDTIDELRFFLHDNTRNGRLKQFARINHANDVIFHFITHTYHNELDVNIMRENADGTYDFMVSFCTDTNRHGGTSLDEVLDKNLDKLKRGEKCDLIVK